ncbi:MAG: methionyl-tRNA formyltransferase [Betaproteobacteria bacterium RIFCSPLOWO2_02_FULL_65_24]|nr:MAG: methionyl-tRNA formyltransferase [Betaproteobacteria bacterium RIFCSPLOWO2_02_FULL_65_24]OGA83643.1 MAG: methionyl-tRNA formyltransferase [Betaproteobacteria bacterium RIFCSPLOWO2_12_FULL_66_14]
MRIVFAGTPDFAARSLAAILNSRHEVALVLTRPDRPAGRGLQLQPSAVKVLALARALPLRQPASLKGAEQWAALRAVKADAMVVAAYGLILPQPVLDIPARGAINIHASLLPRWRGAAPIQRAILAGDRQTGVSIMQMDAGLDTGPVLLKEAVAISSRDTAQSLHDRLADMGARLIVAALDALQTGTLAATPQPEAGVTYARKIDKSEALIHWSADAAFIDRQVRAFNPAPGAHTRVRESDMKIWSAQPLEQGSGVPGELIDVAKQGPVVACGKGSLRLLEVQRAGGRRVPAAQFLRGLGFQAGERLGA